MLRQQPRSFAILLVGAVSDSSIKRVLFTAHFYDLFIVSKQFVSLSEAFSIQGER